jgi:hypothetical protein
LYSQLPQANGLAPGRGRSDLPNAVICLITSDKIALHCSILLQAQRDNDNEKYGDLEKPCSILFRPKHYNVSGEL